ncbi:hypothetical protein CAPTEDRAFT_98473, partial [Capitella teleta]
MVKKLLQHKADIDKPDDEGITALQITLTNTQDQLAQEKIIELLIRGEADVHLTNQDEVSALMIASTKGNVQCIKKLLGYKADPNQRNDNGLTALMLAVCSIEDESTQEKVVDILIKHKADVNLTENRGRSVLQFASARRNVRILTKLLDNGADIVHRDDEGLNALCWAITN